MRMMIETWLIGLYLYLRDFSSKNYVAQKCYSTALEAFDKNV